jgi:hypothetical protein
MKTCGICHTQARDDEPTCSACGEGTFLPAVTADQALPSEPKTDPEEAPVMSKRGKR